MVLLAFCFNNIKTLFDFVSVDKLRVRPTFNTAFKGTSEFAKRLNTLLSYNILILL